MVMGCTNVDTVSYQGNRQDGEQKLSETPAEIHVPIVNYKHVTLTNLNMNNQGDHITIKPGRSIQATMNYAYHCTNCHNSLNNQIIIGLARRSAQVCIYNGGPQAQGVASFNLKVPAKPGIYDVRFRGLQAVDCTQALKAGWNADNSPSKETTIGTIKVSRKAEAT
jgi:hypothetical protein